MTFITAIALDARGALLALREDGVVVRAGRDGVVVAVARLEGDAFKDLRPGILSDVIGVVSDGGRVRGIGPDGAPRFDFHAPGPVRAAIPIDDHRVDSESNS